MPKPHNLSELRFGRLLAKEPCGKSGSHILWRCICDCGKEHQATANNLVRGLISSCGCLRNETTGDRARIHGKYGTGAHKSWKSMLDRCNNPNSTGYARYGGKGISVCDRWREFSNFFSDMGERPPGHSIDRIDTSGNYEPSNCRWATSREQRMNQARGTISLEQAAEVRRLREAHGWGQNTIAKKLGISPSAVAGVIWLGNLAPLD